MVYIQFGQVAAFISMMKAAQAIPHTDLELFPSVQKKLEEKQKRNNDNCLTAVESCHILTIDNENQ